MNHVRFAVSLLFAVFLVPASVSAHCGGNHTGDHPHCSDGGGDDGDGSAIATNDIRVRWGGAAVTGTGTTPRLCSLDGDPQPNGTHIPYFCVQEPVHSISVSVTNGEVADSKGTPSAADAAICSAGFAFSAYPNHQYVVGVGGQVCTGPDGCPLSIHNVMRNQPGMPADAVKLFAEGHVPQSTNLNPFACPDDGSAPTTGSYAVNRLEVRLMNGKGSKADLVCSFDVAGTTVLEVTPVCPAP